MSRIAGSVSACGWRDGLDGLRQFRPPGGVTGRGVSRRRLPGVFGPEPECAVAGRRDPAGSDGAAGPEAGRPAGGALYVRTVPGDRV